MAPNPVPGTMAVLGALDLELFLRERWSNLRLIQREGGGVLIGSPSDLDAGGPFGRSCVWNLQDRLLRRTGHDSWRRLLSDLVIR